MLTWFLPLKCVWLSRLFEWGDRRCGMVGNKRKIIGEKREKKIKHPINLKTKRKFEKSNIKWSPSGGRQVKSGGCLSSETEHSETFILKTLVISMVAGNV